MEQKTVQYKRTLRGSVGAGVGALFNGNGRRYFILEHKDASKYYKAGDSQKIIIDQIELGRDKNCQVRFDDESFPTVSRRHAAIIKDGDKWKLVQLSQTNSTFLNSRPITTEWYLENGDEIQLSVGGPRLGFIVPQGKQSLVSSIKMTERLELFRKQALRPYKTAIAAMGIIILLLSGAGGYKLYDLNQKNAALAKQQMALKTENKKLHDKVVSGTTEIAKNKKEISSLRGQLNALKKGFSRKTPIRPVRAIDNSSKDVYFIGLKGYKITLPTGETGVLEVGDKLEEDKIPFISGTGFLLSDGTFVTARHVVEPWLYDDSSLAIKLNCLATSGGKVSAVFYAVSSTGKTYELTTSQFYCNRSKDKIIEEQGLKARVVENGNTDFAYCSIGGHSSLAYDSNLSKNLKAGEKLIILGFPLGLGATSKSIVPSYSSAEVARDGLAEGGYIMTTSTGFEHGNSGGPVFVERNGKKIVVGIVSAGAGRSTGFVVPISVIK